MCDTLCVFGDGRTLFAKNSDRPVGEVQVVRSFARRAASERPLRTQYIDVGADPGAHAFVGSQPTWLWGVEHGVNEFGVAVGNEKIYTTTSPRALPAALLGMDIVRLALERATTADEARTVVTDLVAAYGQGGSGEADHDEPYFSSFLVADATSAHVVETNDRDWVTRRVDGRGTAISNRVGLGTDWDEISIQDTAVGALDVQSWRASKVPTGIADHRLSATRACVATAGNAADVVAGLRDHGTGPWGNPASELTVPEALPTAVADDWSGVTVCMHVRDYQVTTASMVCELAGPATPVSIWAALGSPCVGVYVPFVAPAVPEVLGDESVWHRFDQLRLRAETAPDALAEIRASWEPFEREIWAAADQSEPMSDAQLRVRLDAGFSALGV